MPKKILVVDCGSLKVKDIENMLHELSCETEKVLLAELPGKTISNYSGVIISGAPILLTEVKSEPFIEKIKGLRDSKIPVLGICFGHQLIGLMYGGEITLCKEDRSLQIISKVLGSPLLNDFDSKFTMMEDHIECVSVPEGFQLIASSPECFNEGMQHNELPIFGIQFHPEVSGIEGKKLFENFLAICK